MKLGEVIGQINFLESRLDVLESRLKDDSQVGRPVDPIIEEVLSTANRLRDLRNAVAWTDHNTEMSGNTLTTYKIQQDVLIRTMEIFSRVNIPETRNKEDFLNEQLHNINLLIKAVNWSVDLQVPTAPDTTTKKEE